MTGSLSKNAARVYLMCSGCELSVHVSCMYKHENVLTGKAVVVAMHDIAVPDF